MEYEGLNKYDHNPVLMYLGPEEVLRNDARANYGRNLKRPVLSPEDDFSETLSEWMAMRVW